MHKLLGRLSVFGFALSLGVGCGGGPAAVGDATVDGDPGKGDARGADPWLDKAKAAIATLAVHGKNAAGITVLQSTGVDDLGLHASWNNRYDILETSADRMSDFGWGQLDVDGRRVGVTWAQGAYENIFHCGWLGDNGYSVKVYAWNDPATSAQIGGEAVGAGRQFLSGSYSICVNYDDAKAPITTSEVDFDTRMKPAPEVEP